MEERELLTLREIQLVELTTLKKFAEFCDKNNLRYFLVGGTLLGAIRHNGFIPWDDDIDVGMPRADYELFKKLMKDDRHLSERILVRIPGDHAFQHPFIKIVNTDYEICYDNYTHETTHYVWVDVFPFDHFPDDEKIHRKYVNTICFTKNVVNFNAIKKPRFSHPKAVLGFAVAKCTAFLLGGSNKFALFVDKFAQKMNKKYSTSSYVGDGTWPNGMKDYFHVSYFSELVKHEFEGATFSIPKEYDAYLTDFYGDYMTLPPVEKRETHHIQVFRPKQND